MVYSSLKEKRAAGKKQLAILIDPDNLSTQEVSTTVEKVNEAKADYIFIGGSVLVTDQLDSCIQTAKANSDIPIVLFPGSPLQISRHADAILLLSLISGRNPELLIGHHVIAAPHLKSSKLEVIPTGYLLIDGGKPTTVSYISHTAPIPHDKGDIAMCTAMAGEMLGMKLIYLDAGSGAAQPISPNMISKVRSEVNVPIIVGGGINNPERAYQACQAGADLVVVGNAVEKDPHLILDISAAVCS